MHLSNARAALLNASVPLTKVIGHIHAPFTHKRLTEEHYHAVKVLAKPGMAFVTRTRGELTNLFIPSYMTHGALYTGRDPERHWVHEAVGKGVVKNGLIGFLLSKDHVRLLRPTFCDEDTMAKAAKWAELQVGIPYDYAFKTELLKKQDNVVLSSNVQAQVQSEEFKRSIKAFYCFEYALWAPYVAVMGQSPWQLREVWGAATVTGDDAVASKKWEVVWDSETALL